MVRAASGLLVLGLACWGGCADVLDIPSDPRVVATGPWRCLGQAPPMVAASSTAQSLVRVQACNFITNCTTTVTGLTAKLCDKRDVGCNNPRLDNITDTKGELSFQVPTASGGFDGYLLVNSRVASCGDPGAFGAVAGMGFCDLVSPGCDLGVRDDPRCSLPVFAPAMLFFNPPIVRDVGEPLSLQLFPTASLPSVIAAAGIELDPTSGNLFIQALDCDGKAADGVSYKIAQHSNQVSSLYVDNGIVSATATRTDSTGIGGFIRVLPGFVSVTGYNSDAVAIGEIGVQTSASTLTYSTLSPSL